MANFKTHMGIGVFIGIGFIVVGLIYSFFSSPEYLAWIFLAVLVGSFIPDIDLDGGIPFQIFFGLLGALIAGLVFLVYYQKGERDVKILIIIPALVFVLVRFMAGYIFEKFTNHRGMFHSVPAAFLSGLLCIWFMHVFSFLKGNELFIGLAVTIGYLTHLVLDEIYSTVDIKGHSLFPKKSLGNALKFHSSSKTATLSVYLLLLLLAFTLPEAREFIKLIKNNWL